MTTSITLRSTKGSALTHAEMDANLTNLQTTADAAKAATDTLTANKAEAAALGVANTDQNMGSFTGTTIADNVSAKVGMQSLETAVETKANASAVGVTSSAANMGTYTGTTISDNQTAKQNLQEIETAVEARPTSATLAASGGSALVGFIQSGTGAAPRTAQAKMREIISVSDFTGFDGTGATDSYAAFAAAVAAAPSTGAVIYVPDSAAIKLDTAVDTGTKKILWRIGATTITGPQGDFPFILSSNGSGVIGSGEDQTIIKLRAPASALVLPTITTGLTAGALTTASPSGGSGFKSTPIVVLTNSPAADAAADDCAVVATVSGGTVSSLAIVEAGSAYVANPTATFYGGGHGAVKIDGVQGCIVRDFSIDFASVPQSVGIYHRGGWWADINNVRAYYDVATGTLTEHASSVGIMIDSYTLGAPGPNGSYGGVYVSHYSNLFFSKRGIVGHDTSTATTLQFDNCDFKNNFIHAAIAITDVNPVIQPISGDFYNLVNVDGLNLIGGDFEGSTIWFHVYGACHNIRMLGTLTYSASGTRIRGPIGAAWLLDPSESNTTKFPLRTGSLNAGQDFQNSGYTSKHRHGITYDGNAFIMATNIRPTSSTAGDLDDTSQAGVALFMNTSQQFLVKVASAGANPRTLTTVAQFDANGLTQNNGTIARTTTAYTNGAGASAGTLGNAPAAGNPTKWIPIDDNGTTRYIPAW